ncbi:hypothetical protein [Treponema sp.]|uniref:hypothetical protein n=1 Tax=Treponema sp. TaxID=166 RepID=UPI003F101EAB
MKGIKHTCIFFYLYIMIAFTGCASLVQVRAEKNGAQTFSFSVDIGDALTAEIQEAIASLDIQEGQKIVLFDTEKIQESLKNSEFKNVSVSSPEFSKLIISGTGNFSSFIVQDKNSLKVKINPENIKKLVDSTPEETQAFMSIFMAPVLTGEKMSSTEYKELLSVFGNRLVQDVEKSSVEFQLVSPSGKATKFSIPLIDFLVLSEEKVLSIEF